MSLFGPLIYIIKRKDPIPLRLYQETVSVETNLVKLSQMSNSVAQSQITLCSKTRISQMLN